MCVTFRIIWHTSYVDRYFNPGSRYGLFEAFKLRLKLKSSNEKIRFDAGHALAELGSAYWELPRAKRWAVRGAIGSLLTALNDSNLSVRKQATVALGVIGSKNDSKRVMEALIEASINHSDHRIRVQAAEALKEFRGTEENMAHMAAIRADKAQANPVVRRDRGAAGRPKAIKTENRRKEKPLSDEEKFLQCLQKLTIAPPPTAFSRQTTGESRVVLSGASSARVMSFLKSQLTGSRVGLGDVCVGSGYLYPIFNGAYACIEVPSGESQEQSARNAKAMMAGNMYSDSCRDICIFRQGKDTFTCLLHDYKIHHKAEW